MQRSQGATGATFIAILMNVSIAVAAPMEAGQAAYNRGDYLQAVQIWENLAARGDRNAEVKLGTMYATGKGVPRDPVKARSWFRVAAFQGSSPSDIAMNIMFVGDTNMIHDPTALAWLQMTAANGNALAQADLGMMYGAGTGMPRDYSKSLSWLTKSAAQGNALGEVMLGAFYENEVKPDYPRALAWYDKSAKQGLRIADNARGLLLARHPELRH